MYRHGWACSRSSSTVSPSFSLDLRLPVFSSSNDTHELIHPLIPRVTWPEYIKLKECTGKNDYVPARQPPSFFRENKVQPQRKMSLLWIEHSTSRYRTADVDRSGLQSGALPSELKRLEKTSLLTSVISVAFWHRAGRSCAGQRNRTFE